MVIASRSAELLPPTGFWYEMARADVFDLRIFDPLNARGPQRRVLMRGEWVAIPVVAGPTGSSMSEARIVPKQTKASLTRAITERYGTAKHWARRGPRLLDLIDQAQTEHLWQFNLHLIMGVRQLLGITTPISLAGGPSGWGGDGIASVVSAYRATTYLADGASRAYVQGDERYEQHGIVVRWSAHRALTQDSILSTLMDHDDPRAVVLAEHPVPRRTGPMAALA